MTDPRIQSAFARVRREAQEESTLAAAASKVIAALLACLFPEQLNFVQDPFRYKTALCSRRAGKSTCCIVYMLVVALQTPGANIQYITLTGKKARKEVWPGLKRWAKRFGVTADPNEQMMTLKLSNGSTINLDGCENISDVDKFRGSDEGYNLVIIDESKSFGADMFAELVDEVITPALADRMGTLCIIGTPGRFLSGRFYEVTNKQAPTVKWKRDEETGGEYRYANSKPFDDEQEQWEGVEYGWSFHHWNTKSNTAKPHIWREQLAVKRKNGWADDDPRWRREYCAEWVADDSGYVYAYLAERNDWEPLSPEDGGDEFGLPAEHEWVYVEGSDLGFDDEFAIVVNAWSPTTNTFYMAVHEYTMPGMDIPAIAKEFDRSEEKFGEFHARVGDRGGLGKTIFATLSNQYDIDIEPAEKQEKRDYQELLNSELRSGRAKVRKGSKLARQMSMLQWKPDGKTEDKESSPKDATDAGLYSWRYIYSMYSKPKEPDPSQEEAIQRRMAEKKAEMSRKMQASDAMDEQERRMSDRFGGDDWQGGDDEWR